MKTYTAVIALVFALSAAHAAREDPVEDTVTSYDDGPCDDLEDAYFDCVGDDCLECLDGVDDEHRETECAVFKETNVCDELKACFDGVQCQSACTAEEAAMKACMVANYEEKERYLCWGVCDGESKFAVE